MRVVIATGIYPPDVGGPATYVPQCAGFLRGRGHDVTVVTTADDLERRDDGVIRVPRSSKLPLLLWHPLRWRKVLRALTAARPVDVVLAAGLFGESALWAGVHGVPLVTRVVADPAWEVATRRGLFEGSVQAFQDGRAGVPARILRLARNLVIRHSDAVIVPSRHVADLVLAWGVQPRVVHIIPNGVDVNRLRGCRVARESRGSSDAHEGRFRLLYVGRLARVKGVHRVIEALGYLDEPFVLEVVGDGPEKEALESLADDRGVTHRVTFLGPMVPDRASQHVAAADALVLASDTEGLSHSILEAMVLGTPVVASAVAGNLELVRDGLTGLLFPPADTRALAGQVSRLASDSDLRQRLVRAASEVGARHDIARTLARAEAVLCSVVEGAP